MSKSNSRLKSGAIAVAPKALPIYTHEEQQFLAHQAKYGAQQKLDRIKGGKTDRAPARAAVERQAAIIGILRALPPSLGKHPTGAKTLNAIISHLASQGIHASEDTIKYDLKILGAARLCEAIDNWNSKPGYVWCAPDNPRDLRKRRQQLKEAQMAANQDICNQTLSKKTLQEMKAGRNSLLRTKSHRKSQTS